MSEKTKEYLVDYIRLGYTIVTSTHAAKAINKRYPSAVITNSNADGIGGTKLLVDKYAANGKGLQAALPKYRKEDVVYLDFTDDFVNGYKGISLFDQVKSLQNESYEKWFERWYKKQDFEKRVLQVAQEGYTAFNINFQSVNDEKTKYLNRRLRDNRTPKKIKENLGEEFDVKYQNKAIKWNLFGIIPINSVIEKIIISWEGMDADE